MNSEFERLNSGFSGATSMLCNRCLANPALGTKLRHCGRCRGPAYCSKMCAQADWTEHKLVCEGKCKYHDEALAAHQTQGGRMRDFDPHRDYIVDWFEAVPGFFAQAELLAWQYRNEAPFLLASASESDVAGKAIRLKVVAHLLGR
mmetsp:Transcript_21494/g.34781  ORF Transcript_21494/g.34781 Transcript_21494/m.34781 type:complete len:146 (+) Transcript_21494:89-526(+)